jgi:hypothetical protein
MFSLFIMCISLHAALICNNDCDCIDNITDCVLDGDTFQFCANFEYKIKVNKDSICEDIKGTF